MIPSMILLAPIKPAVVDLKFDYIDKLVGQHIDKNDIKTILKGLEMEIKNENEEGLTIEIPTYRVDVTRPADVVEDILRIYGYDKINIDSTVHSSLSYSSTTTLPLWLPRKIPLNPPLIFVFLM